MFSLDETRIAVIGLGYVGLPLAVEFGKKFPVTGFDINAKRIDELRRGVDRTLEVSEDELRAAKDLEFKNSPEDLTDANVYIVTTPTPIDEYKIPDLSALVAASESVAKTLAPGDVVIYESTVYPGATEDDCVPVLEAKSGLKLNVDFFVGYSPERINPGDKVHRVSTITKVTSGSTPAAAEYVDALYRSIVTAGTHLAPSIKVAEAAKVIENTQRDVNIALMNELSILFNRMGIDTREVLDAAGTKWNFLPFNPGLVGGHCIGVDPYYLTHKAKSIGHNPEIILAGRRLNDSMGQYVASQLVKQLLKRALPISNARVLIMGFTFKENTPDMRNTRVIDVIRELEDYGIDVDVIDPWVNPDVARESYGITIVGDNTAEKYDAIVIAVAHEHFVALGEDGIYAYGKPGSVVYDLKHVLPKRDTNVRL